MDSLRRDLRYGIRQMFRSAAFTAPAILSLALGIAVNSATFSVFSSLLLRPLGGPGAGDLVRIGRSVGGDGSFRSSTRSELLYLRQHSSTLSEIFGQKIDTFTIAGRDQATTVSGEMVTGNYFSALRVPLQMGRGFSPDEDRNLGQSAVAVISDRFWRRHFDADPAAAGRQIRVNTLQFVVIGVASPEFHGTFPGVAVDIWIPYAMEPAIRDRQAELSLDLMARLEPGSSIAQARAELDGLSGQMARDDPEREPGRGFVIAAARGVHPGIGGVLETFLVLLLATVGVVLLIACANVASLLLARATGRSGEFALRMAVGASRSRLFSQLLVESLLLAGFGAVVGLLLAWWTIRGINVLALASGPTGAALFLNLAIDPRVLAFTAVLSTLSAVAFGFAPAIQATRVDLISTLKDCASLSGARRSKLRSSLVMAQIALSTALLIAAVLLSRSVERAENLELGFDPDPVAVASFNIQLPGYDPVRVSGFYDDLLGQARRLPGAERAALADFIPMGDRGSSLRVRAPDAEDAAAVPYNRITDAYFATIGQPLLRGRDFTAADHSGALPVVIVNEAAARRFWPAGPALGNRIQIEGEPREREVIAVAGDARFASFAGGVGPLIYLPAGQMYGSFLTLHIRSTRPSGEILRDIARLVQDLDPNVPVQNPGVMRERMAFSLLPAVVARAVFAVSGVIALLLASVGLYALVSYTVEQRVREIGLRVALGASRLQVMRDVAGGAFRLALIGTGIGVAFAAGVLHLLSAYLYGLSPADPVAFALVVILLVAITLASAYTAARKALNLAPAAALRND